MVKDTQQIMRAINFSYTMQDFILLYLCSLEDMFLVSETLESTTDNVEVSVCGITPLCQGLYTALMYNIVTSLSSLYVYRTILSKSSCEVNHRISSQLYWRSGKVA